MKSTIAVILLGVVAGTLGMRRTLWQNFWEDMNQMNSDMNQMNSDMNQMNSDIQRNVQNVNQEVHNNLQRVNQEVHNNLRRVHQEIRHNTRRVNQRVHTARQFGNNQYHETRSTRQGSRTFTDGSGGFSRTVYGQASNGVSYYYDSEDRIVGDVLHHTMRIYNHANNSMVEHKYTLDLKDPNAQPIPA